METTVTTADLANLLESTDDYYVEYDADPREDGQVVIRRTVWKRARAKKHQEVLYQADVAVLSQDVAVAMIRDLATCLRFMVGR